MANLVPSETDVALAVKAKLEAATGFAATVPGGVEFLRRPPGSTFPYVLLRVESGPREDVETVWDPIAKVRYASYSQRFTVTATGWTKATTPNDDQTAALRAFLDANLAGGPGDIAGGLVVANCVGVIQAMHRGGRLRLMLGTPTGGQDLLATESILEVMLEGRQE